MKTYQRKHSVNALQFDENNPNTWEFTVNGRTYTVLKNTRLYSSYSLWDGLETRPAKDYDHEGLSFVNKDGEVVIPVRGMRMLRNLWNFHSGTYFVEVRPGDVEMWRQNDFENQFETETNDD